jgi:hypothetical protein
MNYSIRNRLWLCILPAAVATTMIPLARATDDKTYTASTCDLYLPGGEIIRPSHGTLFNYYYDEVRADCPIIRDNIFNTNGIKAVFVRASDDQTDMGNISCTLLAESMHGHSFEWNTAEVQGYWEGSLRLDLDTSYWGGYYHLYCSFPFETEFHGYRVIEYD